MSHRHQYAIIRTIKRNYPLKEFASYPAPQTVLSPAHVMCPWVEASSGHNSTLHIIIFFMICPIDSYWMSQFIFFVKIAIVSVGNAMFKSHKNKQTFSRLMVCPCLMHCCVTRNYPGWRTDSVIDSTVLKLQVSPCSFQSQVSPDLLLLYGQLDKSCLPLDYCYYKRVYKKWEGNIVAEISSL